MAIRGACLTFATSCSANGLPKEVFGWLIVRRVRLRIVFQREIEQGRLPMDCLHNYTGDVPNHDRRANYPKWWSAIG
ncbi:MAG: hypothetical protein ACOX2S_03040 [bacterium]